MLRLNQYEAMHAALLSRGIAPINTPEQYRNPGAPKLNAQCSLRFLMGGWKRVELLWAIGLVQRRQKEWQHRLVFGL
jgi:hypothetical protein